MSRLVVVSNRVADLTKASQSGGLAVALGDALRQRGGLWFGWDGKVVERGKKVPPTIQVDGRVKTVTLPLTDRDYEEYYLGFSNRVLWPVFHYRLDLAKFETAFLEGYQRVNFKFADALVPFLEPDDLIWVHDYHLIPLGIELRQRNIKNRIGFFLHIPFPPPDILAAAPENEWLVKALFAYDVVGFQTETDLANFERYIVEQGHGDAFIDHRLVCGSRSVVADYFPIGIDVDSFYEMAHTPEADSQIDLLERRTIARAHIIGVDRLDYSKGLPDRFRAFERLLERHPENQKAVTFMQIAPPTREDVEAYVDIKHELEALTGSINGQFGDFDWTPLRYIHRSVNRNTLAALLRGSQVGLVTPLRDGMNLVAKEYVAAQDMEDPGVLVLSKFAGAAEDLKAALIVNPYDIDEVADALQTAITMPIEERRQRQNALLERVRRHDAQNWRESFIEVLENVSLGAAV